MPPILHPFPRSLSIPGRSPTWREAQISSYKKAQGGVEIKILFCPESSHCSLQQPKNTQTYTQRQFIKLLEVRKEKDEIKKSSRDVEGTTGKGGRGEWGKRGVKEGAEVAPQPWL